MRNLIGLCAAWFCGAVGWWLGAHAGFAAGMILSALTGAVGLYFGFRWFDENLK